LVLNGKVEGVAEATYRRIWECAEQLGYRRRGAEERVDGKVPPTVGYLLRSPLRLAATSNFFSEVLEGLDEYLAENLARTTFLGAEDDLPRRPLKQLLEQDRGFRGIVVMGEVADETLHSLLALQQPLVYISARAPGLCHSVNANEFAAAEAVVRHLLDLGHRRFSFFSSTTPPSRTQERERAFQAALRIHGDGAEVVSSFSAPVADRTHGWSMAEEVLALPPEKQGTAWVCVGGMVARGVRDALSRLAPGRVETIAIASLDRTQICFHETPTITAAGTDPRHLGKETGRLLLSLTRQDAVKRDLALPATLTIGDTSVRAPDMAER
jgi:DNA-binding LacI/PurR family transcriptional regulator